MRSIGRGQDASQEVDNDGGPARLSGQSHVVQDLMQSTGLMIGKDARRVGGRKRRKTVQRLIETGVNCVPTVIVNFHPHPHFHPTQEGCPHAPSAPAIVPPITTTRL